MTYHFESEMAACAADVENALDALLNVGRLTGPGVPPYRLVEAMRHGSLKGGKRLRPLLVRQAASVFGVSAADSLMAGVAVELIHCYSLIHDDLPAMDDDDMRRGRPTVHKAYDDATAILAGDGLLTLAFHVLATEVHGHNDSQLIAELASGAGLSGMVGGQMRDIEGETKSLNINEISQMQAMKTGALIRSSVRMGAMLGGADDNALKHMTDFAEAAGRAFQLADDLLDVTATPEKLGKATGKDADKGKQTLVSKLGLDGARRQLGDTVHDALTALHSFGNEANGLRETARFFATREN